MKKIFVLLLALLLTSVQLPGQVLGATSVSITSYPSNLITGEEVNISFNATEVSLSSMYNVKGLGGPTFTNVDTWNSGWFQQNSAWNSMPSFSTNNESSYSGIVRVRFESGTSPGSQQFKIRIKNSSGEDYVDSAVVNITVATPVPTPSPTSSPTATPTPAPSPTPVKTPTPTPVKTKTPSPRPTQTPEVLGETTGTPPSIDINELRNSMSTEVPEPTSEPTDGPDKKVVVISVLMIVLGLGLFGAAGYMVYKKSKNIDVSE